MQKSSEIVLPAGTKRVDVIDIPTLIAESLYDHQRAIRANVIDIASLMAESLPEGSSLANKLLEKSSELPLDELERIQHVGLYTQAREHLNKLRNAIVNGELVVFSKVTKSRCGIDDIANAYVKISDFKTFIANFYNDIDVRFANTQPLSTTSSTVPVAVGTSGDGDAESTNWKTRIQTEAASLITRLRASGANPTTHSILDNMVIWSRTHDVKTDGGIHPSANYLRTHVLGGKHWTPPR